MSAAKKLPSDDQGNQHSRGVKPYPIKADLIRAEGIPPFTAAIDKINEIGFIARIEAAHFVKVNDNLSVKFELPVLKIIIEAKVKVVKTYQGVDQYINNTVVKTYMAEFHFRELELLKKEKIREFIRQIGQK